MIKLLKPLIVMAAGCSMFWSAEASAQDDPRVDTIASYPSPTFLENLSVGPDGALLFTSYLDRSVMSWPGTGDPSILTRLDVHPVGILSRGEACTGPKNDNQQSDHGS